MPGCALRRAAISFVSSGLGAATAGALAILRDQEKVARTLDLATPADRPDDIPRLLDALIIEEHARTGGGGELLPVAALGAANVDALKAHPWPDHFVELRAHARRLHAVLTNGLRIRASARALGLKSPSSLVEALERIGVHLKPIDADDAPAKGGKSGKKNKR